MKDYSPYKQYYNEKDFWNTVRAKAAQIPFLRDVLAMFYCLKDPSTAAWAKGLIIAAIGYFIFPFDLVPDVLPIVGWLDDAGVIAGTLTLVSLQIKPKHWDEAGQRIEQMTKV